MDDPAALHPTLWRTCRVLANPQRLRVLALVQLNPGLPVSLVASQLGLSLPLASQALRALESRGFLRAERTGARVRYLPRVAPPGDPLHALTRALAGLLAGGDPIQMEEVFRLATAFTHPRRIEIIRRLKDAPQTAAVIQKSCGLSTAALGRHLRKLQSRGMVAVHQREYRLAEPTGELAAALIELALLGPDGNGRW